MIIKTNIRINNYFIFTKEDDYYLSDIDTLEEWKEVSKNELKNFIKENYNDIIEDLFKKHNIDNNVNFIISDFKRKDKLKGGG